MHLAPCMSACVSAACRKCQVRDQCNGQVSEYLGDLRMRSVNAAMSRVGSRQNLSSTAAAFMDLAEEEEGDNVSRRCKVACYTVLKSVRGMAAAAAEP